MIRELSTTPFIPENFHDLGPNGRRYTYRVGDEEDLKFFIKDGGIKPHTPYRENALAPEEIVTFLSTWPEPIYAHSSSKQIYIFRVAIKPQSGYIRYKNFIPKNKVTVFGPLKPREAEMFLHAVEDDRLVKLYGDKALYEHYGKKEKSYLYKWKRLHNL